MLLTLNLPESLARRLTDRASDGERERFVLEAIERALPRYTDEELERIGAEVEADEALNADMRAFDVCVADGLGDHF